jgi:hypothetical protein
MLGPSEESRRMSKPDEHKVNPESRRDFLKTMMVTGGAVAVLGAGQAMGAEPAEQAEVQPEEKQTGYHVTEHIRNYYAKASL